MPKNKPAALPSDVLLSGVFNEQMHARVDEQIAVLSTMENAPSKEMLALARQATLLLAFEPTVNLDNSGNLVLERRKLKGRRVTVTISPEMGAVAEMKDRKFSQQFPVNTSASDIAAWLRCG